MAKQTLLRSVLTARLTIALLSLVGAVPHLSEDGARDGIMQRANLAKLAALRCDEEG
jgi:hypothetical protein